MPDSRELAKRVAEAVARAWWPIRAVGDAAVPLGVIAAFVLADAAGDFGVRLGRDKFTGPDDDDLCGALREVWLRFALARPDLFIRVGPLVSWLEEPTELQCEAARAVADAAVRAGAVDAAASRDANMLGRVHDQLLRPGSAVGYAPGTPDSAPGRLPAMVVRRGDRIVAVCDPSAGTGDLLLSALAEVREAGRDPYTVTWFAADRDPLVVAVLAVNLHAWGAGPAVVLAVADMLAEPDWPLRAMVEQDGAIHECLMVGHRLLPGRVVEPDEAPQEPL